jgi:VanZ family protein
MNFERRLRWVVVSVMLVYWAMLFLSTHIDLSPGVARHGPGDKTMHTLAYAGLAFLWLVSAAAFGRVTWPTYLVVLVGAALYGAVDETSQALVGRKTDIADWRADMLGAALGMIAFAAVYGVWNLWRVPKAREG